MTETIDLRVGRCLNDWYWYMFELDDDDKAIKATELGFVDGTLDIAIGSDTTLSAILERKIFNVMHSTIVGSESKAAQWIPGLFTILSPGTNKVTTGEE